MTMTVVAMIIKISGNIGNITSAGGRNVFIVVRGVSSSFSIGSNSGDNNITVEGEEIRDSSNDDYNNNYWDIDDDRDEEQLFLSLQDKETLTSVITH